MPSNSELNLAIATYEKLIANYEKARERILQRRRSATDSVVVALDDRLAANQRTIDSLRRAIEVSRVHLGILGGEAKELSRATTRGPRP